MSAELYDSGNCVLFIASSLCQENLTVTQELIYVNFEGFNLNKALSYFIWQDRLEAFPCRATSLKFQDFTFRFF